MNYLLRISLLFFFLSAHFYSLGVTTSENYVTRRDYLGSIATITDKNGVILQTNRYLSGGLPQTAMTINDRFIDNHLYCSMQYTGTHSMGFYDNTARIYDAILTRFTTQDPLSEKYPDISPYASRANNPMKYVDRDGRKIVLADDSSDSFKNNYLIAYNYLKRAQASFVIDELDKKDNIYIIKEFNDNSKFDHNHNTIYWNPHRVLLTTTGYVLTSAELLSHEADHAVSYDEDPKSAINRLNTQDNVYGNKEEKRVIEDSEQAVAIKLNRVLECGTTRTDHFVTGYYVDSPDSDEYECITIIVDKNKIQKTAPQ